MFDPVDNYRWEAERENGEIITKGGSLSGCVRFSLIPNHVNGFQQHDLAGVKLRNRFERRFKTVRVGSDSIGKLHWRHNSCRVDTPEDLIGVIKKGDMIRVLKLENPYPWSIIESVEKDHVVLTSPWLEEKGRDAVWMTTKFLPPIPDEHYHCIVCDGFRMWVRSATGGVLITPESYELYI